MLASSSEPRKYSEPGRAPMMTDSLKQNLAEEGYTVPGGANDDIRLLLKALG